MTAAQAKVECWRTAQYSARIGNEGYAVGLMYSRIQILTTFSGGKGDTLPPCQYLSVTLLPITGYEMQIWKPVLGFEGFYEASENGEIKSIQRRNTKNKRLMGGDFVKPILGSRGYLVVNLTKPETRKQVFLHKVILEAFVGPRPQGFQCCHNDGNKLNCNLENLDGTRFQTITKIRDCMEHGKQGEKANNAKLTNEIVIFIRTIN